MTDPAERLRRARELFDAALELPEGARSELLAAGCAGDDALRREVEGLLAADARTAGPLDRPLSLTAPEPDRVGQRLGPYELLRLVGLGGMGAVYEAVRADDQYRKRVAIKLVQGRLQSALTLARFRRERQILADLSHKNVAALLDGGVGPDGQPFLVMEFVEGEPITTWCDRRRLSTRRRVELFRQVCDAVRHAHQKLVVHRDLKPGNILVTADGSVKLLDFGVARLLGDDGEDATLPLTRGGQRAFTPEYASPEQVRGDALTTASDVYSLGAVLYELLAGRRPHAAAGTSVAAIEHAVLDQPIPRPGAVVDDAAAAARGERDAAALRRRLAGDLDAICLLAVRAEPGERYASVESFADDLRRHLAGMPVLAQRGWAGYRMRKFIVRHRVPVGAAALVLLALAGGVIATTLEARRARTSQARAERVSDFLAGLLASVRPSTGGRDVPVSELLDAAAKRTEIELADEPAVQAELESVIGLSYLSLARYDDAERHLRAALSLHARTDGPRSTAVVLALNNLGRLQIDRGDLLAADSSLQRALALQRVISPKPDTLTATLLANAGSAAHSAGRIAEAEGYHRQTLALRQRLLGPHDDLVAYALGNLGVALGEQGRWTEAEPLQRRAFSILKGNHPGPSTEVANAENALATAVDLQGHYVEAESLYRDVLHRREVLLGRDHPDYAFTLVNFSMFVFDRGRYDDAARMSREILALRGKTIPDSHPTIAAALQTLGRCMDKAGRHDEADRDLTESLDLRRRYLGPDHWLLASSMGLLGEHCILVREYPRAERLLLQAEAILEKSLGPDHPRTVTNLKRLVSLYEAWGRPQQADRYRKRLPSPGA